MSLGALQRRFAHMVASLLMEAFAQGYEVTFGETWRPQVTALYYAATGRGITNSFHTKRLAIDLNLFKDGVYLTETEDYRPLGEFWISIGGTWGGTFKRMDGSHFSLGE